MRNAKEDLESFVYDKQYLEEKSKEIEGLKDHTQRSLARLRELEQSHLPAEIVREKVEKVMQKQAEEEDRIVCILERKQQIENALEALPQPYRTVLYLHYLRFMTFDQIAARMHYSSKRIYQLHAIGLAEFEKVYGNR